MKKLYTTLALALFVFSKLFSQDCHTPYRICAGMNTFSFPATTTYAPSGPDYGCLNSQGPNPPNPIYVSFKVGTTGSFIFNIASTGNYIGTVCWGPYTDPALSCAATSGNIADCSYSPGTSTDTITIQNAQAGEIYVICISKLAGLQQGFTISQTGGSGTIYCAPAGCNIFTPPSVCFVNADTSSHNNVYFNHTSLGAEGVIIYRENTTGGWDSVGYTPSSQPDKFVDLTSSSNQQSYVYCIAQVDSCGTIHSKSSSHKTMLLQSSVGTGGQVNLSWNAYQGISYNTYYIFRGGSPSAMSLLTKVNTSSTAYTDLSPLPGANYYKVAIKAPTNCTSNAVHDTLVSSNFRTNGVAGIQHLSFGGSVNIYPNPAHDRFTIQTNLQKETLLQLSDLNGRVLLKQLIKDGDAVSISSLSEGVYTMSLATEQGIITKKLVIIH